MLGHGALSSNPIGARAVSRSGYPRVADTPLEGRTRELAITGATMERAAIIGRTFAPELVGEAD